MRRDGGVVFARAILALIRFYQRAVSPLTPPTCRFTPSCSEYAAQSVHIYGAGRGGWMAFKRILRCNPFGGQGYDPVPGLIDTGDGEVEHR